MKGLEFVKFKHESASALLTHIDDNIFELKNVRSEKPGLGHATTVLQAVVDYADEHNLIVCLVAQQYGPMRRKDLDNVQLIEFYSKFGFELVKPRPAQMIRKPSQDLPPS